jgi:hypothetical protein
LLEVDHHARGGEVYRDVGLPPVASADLKKLPLGGGLVAEQTVVRVSLLGIVAAPPAAIEYDEFLTLQLGDYSVEEGPGNFGQQLQVLRTLAQAPVVI